MAIKLAIFDMEGTLFSYPGHPEQTSWYLVAYHLGEEAAADRKSIYEKWHKIGHEGYVDWANACCLSFQHFGLTKESFERTIHSVNYFDGVRETFQELHNQGIVTAVISGGFQAQAERTQIELGVHHAYAACVLDWDNEGKLIDWTLQPMHLEGKLQIMQQLQEQLQLQPEDVAFVGDGPNDIPIAQAAGVSIAWNGVPALQKICTHSINTPDFRRVLEYIH